MITNAELMQLLETRSCGCIILNGMLRNIAWSGVGPEDVEIWFFNPAQMSKPMVSYVFSTEELCMLIKNQQINRAGFHAKLGFSRW